MQTFMAPSVWYCPCSREFFFIADQSSSGWLSSITSMVGNMFVSDEGSPRIEQMRARNSLLMALYEAVHLNRNFIATLAHYQTESAPSPQLPQK